MKKWEYDIFKINDKIPVLHALNALGEEGWEAYFLDHEEQLIFCKRPKSEIVLLTDKPHTPGRIV